MKFSKHCPWCVVSQLLTGWPREPSFFIPEARQAPLLLRVVRTPSQTAPFLGPRSCRQRSTGVTSAPPAPPPPAPPTRTLSSSLGSQLHRPLESRPPRKLPRSASRRSDLECLLAAVGLRLAGLGGSRAHVLPASAARRRPPAGRNPDYISQGAQRRGPWLGGGLERRAAPPPAREHAGWREDRQKRRPGESFCAVPPGRARLCRAESGQGRSGLGGTASESAVPGTGARGIPRLSEVPAPSRPGQLACQSVGRRQRR